MCTKVKFADEAATKFYIKKLKDTSLRMKKPVAAYLCSECLCWHLTSRTPKDDIQAEKYRATIKNQKIIISQLTLRLSELKQKHR